MGPRSIKDRTGKLRFMTFHVRRDDYLIAMDRVTLQAIISLKFSCISFSKIYIKVTKTLFTFLQDILIFSF